MELTSPRSKDLGISREKYSSRPIHPPRVYAGLAAIIGQRWQTPITPLRCGGLSDGANESLVSLQGLRIVLGQSSSTNGSLVSDPDGKLFNGPEARPLPPMDGLLGHGQLELRPALEQRFERALALDAGELVAQAEMDACAE